MRRFVFPVLLVIALSPQLSHAQRRIAPNVNCESIPQLFEKRSAAATALEDTCRAAGDHDTRIKNLESLKLEDYKAITNERLSRIDPLEGRVKSIETLKPIIDRTATDIRRVWVLLAAGLVFLMQAGFICVEGGFARAAHSGTVTVLNLSSWFILCIVFYFGFGVMFGHDWHHLVGIDMFFPRAGDFTAFSQTLRIEFFLFQLGFAATAATIVDGALAERVAFPAYFLVTIAVGAVIYPVFGHWAWGGAIDGTPLGWLAAMGFKDFAGSTVVHSVGAWVAWVGIIIIGPRRFRFGNSSRPLKSFNPGISGLGVFLLGIGWWGFNGGSVSKFEDPDFIGRVSSVILNTMLAGAAAGISAFLFARLTRSRYLYEKLIGGALGGWVAITASCDTADPLGALAIGAAAGIVHNLAFDLLIRLGHDDVAGAVPVHGFCGVWGTLCAAFGTGKPLLSQFGIQLIGIVTALGWTVAISTAVFLTVERLVGVRLSIKEEDEGDEALSQVA